MSLTVIKEPDTVSYTRNPIALAVHSDQANAVIYAEIYMVPDELIGYELVATIDGEVDDDGMVSWDIKEICDAQLFFDVPSFALTTFEKLNNTIRNGYIKLYEYVSGSLTDSHQTSAVTFIKGGINYQEYPTADFFTYMTTQKKFLSWNNGDFKASTTQKLFLTFLNYTGSLFSFVNPGELFIDIHYTDGSTHTPASALISNIILSTWEACFLPIGYQQLDIGSYSAKTVKYYDVYLKHVANTISEKYRVCIEQRYFRNEKNFIWINSLGGVDNLMAVGESEYEFPVTQNLANKINQYWYQSDQGQEIAFNLEEQEEIEANTGYITKGFLDKLRDFLLSEKKYEIIDQHMLEIIQDKKAMVKIADNDNLAALSFKYHYNFKNSLYTPVSLRNTTPDSEPELSSSSS